MGSNHDVATIDDQPRIPLARLALDLTDRSVRAETVTRVHRVREIPDRAEMAIVPIPRVRLATVTRVLAAMAMRVRRVLVVTGLTHHARLVMAMRVPVSLAATGKVAPGHPETTATGPTLPAPLVMVMRVRHALVLTGPIPLALRVMANVRILPVPHATGTRVRHAPVETVPIHLVLRVLGTRGRHVRAVTVPTHLAPRETVTRVRAETGIVHGMTAHAPIGPAAIARMATGPAGTGSLRAVGDVRSGRR